MTTSTPTEITESVRNFCLTINADEAPSYVEVRPDANATHVNCYPNVADKVAQHGGTALHGWIIWEEPGFFLEAEHHAVWVSPDGERLDITPHEGENHVLFLPDPAREWRKKVIPNRRFALRDDPRLLKFLQLAEERDQLKATYADKNGEAQIPLGALLPLEMKMIPLIQSLGLEVGPPPPQVQEQMCAIAQQLYPTTTVEPLLPPLRQVGRNERCPCGSGKKFKRCCGRG